MPSGTTDTFLETAKNFAREISKIHEMPRMIIYDKKREFISAFLAMMIHYHRHEVPKGYKSIINKWADGTHQQHYQGIELVHNA